MGRFLLNMGMLTGISKNRTLVREMSKLWMPLGKRIAVIGGGLVGVEMAVFLAERGREVSLCEESANLAVEMAVPRRWRALHELRRAGVDVYTETRIDSIGEKTITCILIDGKTKVIDSDTVIIAKGIEENLALYDALKQMNSDVHVVGDCGGPGYIKRAMRDAAEIAGKI